MNYKNDFKFRKIIQLRLCGKLKISEYQQIHLNLIRWLSLFVLRTAIITIIIVNIMAVTGITADDPMVEIGNITRIKGDRDNQLLGFGIVMGLAGSGDSSRSQSTVQSISNMMGKYGIDITPDQVRSRNVAAVMVTAILPSFAHNGDTIDVTVNSMGDARSLQGGTLIMTPLKAANGDVYAVAQGPVSIGGYNEKGSGYQVRENHPTAGRIPNGAFVEKEISFNLEEEQLTYLLHQPNYETANAVADIINSNFEEELNTGDELAKAGDSRTVVIRVPEIYQNNIIEFISKINKLQVQSSIPARVVLNERTGTVVMGHNVEIATVSVQQNNFSVKITTEEEVSQPPSFSEGETEIITDTNIEVSEEEGEMQVIEGAGNIEDLVTALNAIGASSRDIIAIIQAVDQAGALHAELIIM